MNPLEPQLDLATIVNNMRECLWVGDKKHKTLYVNPAFERLSGYSLEESIGKDCDFFFDEKGKKIIQENHLLRKKGIKSDYEAVMISKSGTKIPFLICGAPTETGGTIGIFTDLTEVKALEQQAAVSKEILENSPEAIVVLNEKRLIQSWNDGATKLFGYNENEVLKKSIDIIIPLEHQEENKSFIADIQKKKHIKNFETRRLNKSGDYIHVAVSASKIKSNLENEKYYLVVYRDITQQKRTSNELQKRFDAIQDAYKELGLQRRSLDYLCEIIDLAVEKSSTGEIYRLIISAFSLLTKCDCSILRLYEKEKNILKLQTTFGVTSNWNTKDQIKFKNSIAQEAFKTRRPVIINDIDSYRKHQGLNLLKSHHLKTLILLPLYIEDHFIGSISLYATDPSKFRLIETDFLERMSRQSALAIFAKQNLNL